MEQGTGDWERVRVPTGSWWSSFLPRSGTCRHPRWSWWALELQEGRRGSPGGWTENICLTQHFFFLFTKGPHWMVYEQHLFLCHFGVISYILALLALYMWKQQQQGTLFFSVTWPTIAVWYNLRIKTAWLYPEYTTQTVCDYLCCGSQQGVGRRGGHVLHFDLLFSRFTSSWGRAIHGRSWSIALHMHKHT